MKLIDVAQKTMGRNAPRIAYKADASPSPSQPADAERDAIKNAIRAATTYAVIVIKVDNEGDPFETLAVLADFIRELTLPESFSGYAIVQRAAAAAATPQGKSNVFILAKALGSETATPIRLPDDKSDSEAVTFYDDSVAIKADFVARIDELCNDAFLIGAVGKRGVIPLWMPMTFVPSH